MFTPVETTIGALLLHQATSNLLYQNGNILGASGFLRQLLSAPTKELLAFFTGMAASSIPLKALAPQSMTSYPEMDMTLQSVISTAAISALIGWGTKVGSLFTVRNRRRLTEAIRCRMAALPDTCFAAFLG